MVKDDTGSWLPIKPVRIVVPLVLVIVRSPAPLILLLIVKTLFKSPIIALLVLAAVMVIGVLNVTVPSAVSVPPFKVTSLLVNATLLTSTVEPVLTMMEAVPKALLAARLARLPSLMVSEPLKVEFAPAKIEVPAVCVILPLPLKVLNVVVLVLSRVSMLPVFKVPIGRVILLAPPIVTVSLAPIIKLLFPRMVLVAAANVPPFKFKVPVPNGFVALFAVNVPFEKVIEPL